MDDIIELRHDLHKRAERSGQEEKTARYIRQFLEETNPNELITELGGEGLLASYGSGNSPSVLLRCELDALPIPEENPPEYRSEDPETGHKCGHDGHMAILCGVARKLSAQENNYGTVHLLFQPAEETGEGAQRVLEDEQFQHISPDYVFALHNLPKYPMGQVVLREETFAAASVGCILRLKGETSHAAHPEQGRSPALAVSQLIDNWSALPQFQIPLNRAAKVTLVHAKLGEQAFGTSPGTAEVMATVRTYSNDLLEELKSEVQNIGESIAEMHELEHELEWVEPFPATVNDSESVEVVRAAARKADLEVEEMDSPFGWSEDFGHFTGRFKGALFGLGSGRNQASLHAPDYDFPDELIAPGVAIFEQIIQDLNKKN